MAIKGGFMKGLLNDTAQKLDVSNDEARLYPERLQVRDEDAATVIDERENSFGNILAAQKEGKKIMEKPVSPFSGSKTVISKGTVINGNVTSEGDIELYGTINGNVEAKGDFLLDGVIKGDIKAKDVNFCKCEMRGNIMCGAKLYIDNDSVLYGDVIANDIDLDGKVKGNVKIKETAVLKANAILFGNLEAGSISIDQGAKLRGEVKIVFDTANNDIFDNEDFEDFNKKDDVKQGTKESPKVEPAAEVKKPEAATAAEEKKAPEAKVEEKKAEEKKAEAVAAPAKEEPKTVTATATPAAASSAPAAASSAPAAASSAPAAASSAPAAASSAPAAASSAPAAASSAPAAASSAPAAQTSAASTPAKPQASSMYNNLQSAMGTRQTQASAPATPAQQPSAPVQTAAAQQPYGMGQRAPYGGYGQGQQQPGAYQYPKK